MTAAPSFRKCIHCKMRGPDSMFFHRKGRPQNICMACRRSRHAMSRRAYRNRHVDRIRADDRQWKADRVAACVDAIRDRRRAKKILEAAASCGEGAWKLCLRRSPYSSGFAKGERWTVWPVPMADPPGKYPVVAEVVVMDGVRSMVAPPVLPADYQPVVAKAIRKFRREQAVHSDY